jgi:hypothetical protein
VVGDGGGRQLRRRSPGIVRLRPRRDQLGRVGVEAEADLTAALFDERRKPIREGGQGLLSP